MSSRRRGEAGLASGKGLPVATVVDSPWPPRVLVVDLHPPHWGHTCPKLCQALENVFALACGLAGPPRIPLFSLYVARSQQECLLPFLVSQRLDMFTRTAKPVRGGFARLQSCLAELRAFPAEGAFCPPTESPVVLAVQDGLQQFKQYTGRGMAGSSLSNCAMEVTVLTSQCGREVAWQLEAGLENIDLAHLRQLQVVEVSKERSQEPPEAGGREEEEALSDSESGTILGTNIALLAVENEVVALEMFFKAWFHDHSGNQEHLHLLLPTGGRRALGYSATHAGNLVCVKCDLQEKVLNPAMMLLTASGRGGSQSMAEAAAHEAFASGPRATPSWRLAPRRLRVIRALEASGLCASLLFGPSLVILPTICWQLNWDELEANQHRFQALCHGLQVREWLLLARDEAPPGGHGPTWSHPDATLQALLPSESGTLLLRSVATQELLLPCTFPTAGAPTGPPEAERQHMEVILNSLGVEAPYNPLSTPSPLYRALKQSLGKNPTPRGPRPAERHLPPRQQVSRGHGSKARATVPPLRMVAPLSHFSFSSSPEEDFQDPPK